MDECQRICAFGHGCIGCGCTNRLHNPTAKSRQVHPIEAGEESPESTFPRKKSVLLLRLSGQRRDVRELHGGTLVSGRKYVTIPLHSYLRLLFARYSKINLIKIYLFVIMCILIHTRYSRFRTLQRICIRCTAYVYIKYMRSLR